MERLLQGEDFRFLSSQPGFSSSLGRHFRSERRRIFRSYLRNLSKDFSRVSMACHMLIIHAADDRGDLAKRLIRKRLMFRFGVVAIEGRLFLHTAAVGTSEFRSFSESLQ